jgi:hypothetical protein
MPPHRTNRFFLLATYTWPVVDSPRRTLRHRVLWLNEMTKEEIKQVGESGPTIDSIEMADFDSHADLREWLDQKAPAFLR